MNTKPFIKAEFQWNCTLQAFLSLLRISPWVKLEYWTAIMSNWLRVTHPSEKALWKKRHCLPHFYNLRVVIPFSVVFRTSQIVDIIWSKNCLTFAVHNDVYLQGKVSIIRKASSKVFMILNNVRQSLKHNKV